MISNSSILYDTESYEHKALCCMMRDKNHVNTIDDLDECDGTLFQFGIIRLFFSSTNHLESLKPFQSSNNLCNLSGIKCETNNQFIKKNKSAKQKSYRNANHRN